MTAEKKPWSDSLSLVRDSKKMASVDACATKRTNAMAGMSMRSHLDQRGLFKKLTEWIKQVIAEGLNLAISQ